MMGKNKSIEDRAATVRIGAQKRWAMSAFNTEVCGACGNGSRSSKHALLRCGEVRMKEMRKIWMNEVSKRIMKMRSKDIRGAIEELWTKMRNNEGGEYAICGVFQARLMDKLYMGNMEIREGEDRTIMRILRQIGEGARELIKLYVEIKGVDDARRELRQTNMMGFYGRGGEGIDNNNRRGNTGKITVIRSNGKKRRKRKSSVILRKGAYVVVGNEGGDVKWDFITG
jgi:hypothetical protein